MILKIIHTIICTFYAYKININKIKVIVKIYYVFIANVEEI